MQFDTLIMVKAQCKDILNIANVKEKISTIASFLCVMDQQGEPYLYGFLLKELIISSLQIADWTLVTPSIPVVSSLPKEFNSEKADFFFCIGQHSNLEDASILFYQSALSLYPDHKHLKKAICLSNIATCYQKQEKYTEAISFFLQASIEFPEENRKSECHFNAAECYMAQQKPEMAINAYSRAASFSDNKDVKASCYLKMAEFYYESNNYNLAIKLYVDAILGSNIMNSTIKSYSYEKMGDCYAKLEDFDRAKYCYHQVKDIARSNKELCEIMNQKIVRCTPNSPSEQLSPLSSGSVLASPVLLPQHLPINDEARAKRASIALMDSTKQDDANQSGRSFPSLERSPEKHQNRERKRSRHTAASSLSQIS